MDRTETVSASMVLYNSDPREWVAAVDSFLANGHGRLVIVDNSPSKLESEILRRHNVLYIHSGRNIGFGAGHNVALRYLDWCSRYHLFLNPDVEFRPSVVSELAQVLNRHPAVSCIMPEVLYSDGKPQYLAKRLPTPCDLFVRRFVPSEIARELVNSSYVIQSKGGRDLLHAPALSGCFLLCRTDALRAVGGFDERFFLYMEDFDLVRRLGALGDTGYYPAVQVRHGFRRASYRFNRSAVWHIVSAIKYFQKWGWVVDEERRRRNALGGTRIGE